MLRAIVVEGWNRQEEVVRLVHGPRIGRVKVRLRGWIVDVVGRIPRCGIPAVTVQIVQVPELDLHDDVTLPRQT
jgi:hypothetical protein